jgi:hypothetical protein
MEGYSEKKTDRTYTQVTQRNLDRNHSQDTHAVSQDRKHSIPRWNKRTLLLLKGCMKLISSLSYRDDGGYYLRSFFFSFRTKAFYTLRTVGK